MSVLDCQPRTAYGTRASWKLRKDGRLPAVIYGEGGATETVSVPTHEFEAALRHHERVLELEQGGKKQKVLIHDLQWDPIGDHIAHIDFLRIAEGHAVEVDVEIDFVGHPKALSHGGEFVKQMSDLKVSCQPDKIPEKIVVQVGELDLQDAVHVRDLELPEGVTPLAEPDDVVCNIHARLLEAEAAEVEGEEEESAEPEVIAKGKAEEEPGEGE